MDKMKPKKKVRKSGYYWVRTTITDLQIAKYHEHGEWFELFGMLGTYRIHDFIAISKNEVSSKKEMVLVYE